MPRKASGVVYETLSTASEGMGIPVPVLRFLKSKGCNGFKGSRIYEAPVRNWIDEHPDVYALAVQSPVDGQKVNPLQKRQIELLDIKIKREAGDLVPKEAIAEASSLYLSATVEIARRHLSPEAFNMFCKETREALQKIASEVQ